MNYRVIRLPKSCGGHLIISHVDDEHPTGSDAACPTGNTRMELIRCLETMLTAVETKTIINRDPVDDVEDEVSEIQAAWNKLVGPKS